MIRAWVDPEFGVDGPGITVVGSPFGTFAQVDDPEAPFKTLQHAIDAVHFHVINAFSAGQTDVEGIVYAMPGLYGPTIAGAGTGNGEEFPIFMRDRVHVQGQGARGCVIRGMGTTVSPVGVFLPLAAGQLPPSVVPEVLVDFSESSKLSQRVTAALPWALLEETSEMLDGFTFQGGAVQVMFYKELSAILNGAPELRGRISNCLFDMRDGWLESSAPNAPLIAGPIFGVQMAKAASLTSGSNFAGYPDQRVVITNNTFLMAELSMLGGDLSLVTRSRDDAVAIIDVTDNGCASGAIVTDPDSTLRGLGSPMIVNNLFRTHPFGGLASIRPFAMLGIDGADTDVSTNVSPPGPSNAFASELVGSAANGFSNGKYASMQVAPRIVGVGLGAGVGFPSTLIDCHNPANPACGLAGGCCPPSSPIAPCAAASVPTPAVEIFFRGTPATTGEVDPVFVGEFLAPGLSSPPSRYRDWRILPGSPLIDAGLTPFVGLSTNGGLPQFGHNGTLAWTYAEPACKEFMSFDWDHEGFGNPRVSGASADIGFDEFQMFIMAGSYANDSNSHNVSGFLNPTPEAGRPGRVMIFPNAQGTATLITVNGVFAAIAAPPPAPPAWTEPPRTTQVIKATLPVGFQTRYISFANNAATGTPTPWPAGGGATPNPTLYLVPWNVGQGASFGLIQLVDAESSHGYFGTQAVLHGGDPINAPVLWSNLQYEYR